MPSHHPKVRFSVVVVLALQLLAASVAFAQGGAVITGRITSDRSAPIEGANVVIAAMSISVFTDSLGHYSIAIPAQRVLQQTVLLRARAIGHLADERTILVSPGTQSRDFVLRRDINRLQEIVVTGAVTATEQGKVGFAITTLGETDLAVPSTDPLQQLQAKVPGAHIVQPSGLPGTSPSILLRGPKSLNASGRSMDPLILVDGIILEGSYQDIDPLDIERIEIVKGAAGSSLYGSRAAAGVIQITTRSARGAPQGSRFSARSEIGFKDVQNEYPYATRHFLMMDETNRRFCLRISNEPLCSRTVDWEEERTRINDQPADTARAPHPFERDYGIARASTKPELKGLFQINRWPTTYNPIAQIVTNGLFVSNHADLTARMGGTAAYLSGSQLSEQGAIRFLTGFDRLTARANVDQRLTDRWDLALSSMFSRGRKSVSGEFFRVTRVPPSVDLLKRDRYGRLYIRSNPLVHGGQNNNPLYNNENVIDNEGNDRFLGSMSSRYRPVTWLDFDANISLDRRHTNALFFQDRGYRTNGGIPFQGSIAQESGTSASYNWQLSGTARRAIRSDLYGTVHARYTSERQDLESHLGQGTGLAVPSLPTLGNATLNKVITSSITSVRALGVSSGASLDFRDRYILDGVLRYDGSSLFGEKERWHPYYRTSLVWRLSDEPFWRLRRTIDELKLRASVGTAGGRPNFVAQYETFSVGTGGIVTAQTLGNRRLKPERTLETEYGIDAQVLQRYGVNLTFARDITTDQIMLVPAPVAGGFGAQWRNAGTLDGKTWELALNVPVLTTRTLAWTSRVTWDRNRTYITDLAQPPFLVNLPGFDFRYAVGERMGNIYGRRMVTRCAELPAQFQSQCGPNLEYQTNDEGYVVWVGAGNSWSDGVTKNLWQAVRPGCLLNGVATNATGEKECLARGGTINAPWAIPEVHWGMPLMVRDSAAQPVPSLLGNTQPDYRVGMSQNVQWRKWRVYGLADLSMGNEIMNQERHWSMGDFMVREQDQDGKTVDTAKPIGYYWRAGLPQNGAGVGGFYDVNIGTNRTIEDASYLKLREVSVAYDLGDVRGLGGQWSISVSGRNLYTWSKFLGWDPEVGVQAGTGGQATVNSAALSTVATYQYPPTRTYTIVLSSRF